MADHADNERDGGSARELNTTFHTPAVRKKEKQKRWAREQNQISEDSDTSPAEPLGEIEESKGGDEDV